MSSLLSAEELYISNIIYIYIYIYLYIYIYIYIYIFVELEVDFNIFSQLAWLPSSSTRIFSSRFQLCNALWESLSLYHNQLVLYLQLSRIKEYRCLRNVNHKIGSKNEWLLLSASFTAKFGLFFVLTLEMLFLRGIILKATTRT